MHLVGISQKFEGFFAICYTCFWKSETSTSLRDVNSIRKEHLKIVSFNNNSVKGRIRNGR